MTQQETRNSGSEHHTITDVVRPRGGEKTGPIKTTCYDAVRDGVDTISTDCLIEKGGSGV